MRRASLDEKKDLSHLIERYGHGQVWNAGVEVLGYPPTWWLSELEVLLVTRKLENKDTENAIRM